MHTNELTISEPATMGERALRSAALLASLTERQQQVLTCMAEGLRNKQIAHLLGIGEKTIKMHRAALLERISAGTTAGAVRVLVEASFAPAFAVQRGSEAGPCCEQPRYGRAPGPIRATMKKIPLLVVA